MKQKKPEATCRVIRFEYNSVTGNVITASEGTAAVPSEPRERLVIKIRPEGPPGTLWQGSVSGLVAVCSLWNNSLSMKCMFCAHFCIFVTLQ